MKTLSSKFINNTKIIILALIIGLSVNYIFAAWTNPPANPPTCPDTTPGCNTPINQGLSPQIKQGGLIIKGLQQTGDSILSALNGLIVENGNVGIGTLQPTQKLHVVGDAFIQGNILFPANVEEKIKFYNDAFTMGVQPATLFFRSGSDFKFYKGGSYASNTESGDLLMNVSGETNKVLAKDFCLLSDPTKCLSGSAGGKPPFIYSLLPGDSVVVSKDYDVITVNGTGSTGGDALSYTGTIAKAQNDKFYLRQACSSGSYFPSSVSDTSNYLTTGATIGHQHCFKAKIDSSGDVVISEAFLNASVLTAMDIY